MKNKFILNSIISIFALQMSLSSVSAALLHHGKEKDRAAIKKFQGCYKVSFRFAETFPQQDNYQIHKPQNSGGLELIILDDETQDMISLQHLLITPVGIIKHWRQQWEYENQELLNFRPPMNYDYVQYEPQKVAHSWTQKVYQVDDGPRYECSAPWIHSQDGSYWECLADNPLPRREYTKRNDYNVLNRRNRHQIMPYGHLHEQDSTKVDVQEDGTRVPLVMEKGYNTYRRVDMKKCESAQIWWEENKEFWSLAKEVWNSFYKSGKTLSFKTTVEGQKLWQVLFDLNKKFNADSTYRGQMVSNDIQKSIQKFLN